MRDYTPIVATKKTIKELLDTPSLVLSFIGDSVYSLFVRHYLMEKSPYNNSELHKLSIKEVRAETQSDYLKILLPHLDENEDFIVRKAKNTKTNNLPKHASLYQYHQATAFEALVGFLYLSGNSDRLYYLLELVYNNNLGNE